jgi:hypothetical protein
MLKCGCFAISEKTVETLSTRNLMGIISLNAGRACATSEPHQCLMDASKRCSLSNQERESMKSSASVIWVSDAVFAGQRTHKSSFFADLWMVCYELDQTMRKASGILPFRRAQARGPGMKIIHYTRLLEKQAASAGPEWLSIRAPPPNGPGS